MKRRYRDRLIIVFLFAGAIVARSNPTGGAVTAGSASIAGQGTSTVQINQASNTAIINWQTFSIGSGELTKFVQPSSSSATLNRVLGGQTSIIDGTLSANGQIYLLNGNGIVVGPGGVINTAGFTGSTRDISDPDFLSGNLHFTGSGKAGVKNYGTINALGGDVVLIGKTVDNAGTINATGTAGLIAGDDVLLAQNNADGSTITVNPVSAPVATRAKVGVLNTGTITASSAELKAANGNIYALAIQNEGIIRATTVSHQGGHIYLTSDTGTVSNTGTLDASATVAGGKGGTILVKSTSGKVVHSGKIIARGGQGGAGGNAEVSGAQLEFTGSIDLTAPGGTTGNLLLDPGTLTVLAGTGGTVDVITPGSPNDDENDPGPSTIGAGLVDSILNGANLTLNADTNITVNSAISWNAATTLTLSTNSTAGTSIAINASITDSNTTQGGLTIDTRNAADPISATGAISVANFILQNGAWTQNVAPNAITGVSQLPGFTTTHDFEINGGTFLRSNGGNGGTTLINGSQVDTPYLISDVYGLQGINGFLSSDFTIYQSAIDASGTSSWNNGLGFIPIGFSTPTGATVNPYTGNFYGGEIDNLTIHQATTNADTNSVGLVADLQGSITYLNLTGASITGYGNVGAMAGLNEGTIFNTSISSTTVTGNNSVGFDAGDNEGYIQYCYVNSGTVTGVSLVGGIAGLNNNLVQGGSSGGTVNGTTEVGGVVGENDSSVDGVGGYAAVNGNTQVGGIVGLNIGTVDASTGSATVTGTDTSTVQSAYVGGLVGENDGTVTTSSTTTSSVVSGDLQVGGLVGYNTGTITDVPLEGGSVAGSFNSGSVTGNASTISGDVGSIDIGGVAGLNTGLVMDSYNTGAVTGRTDVGGVAGENQQVETGGFNSDFRTEDFSDQPTFSAAAIQTSYNSGTVAGSGASNGVGGIVGLNDSGASVNTTYNVGAIGNGNSIAAGGIVGINAGIVIDTYNSGAVTGTRAGGLIGTEQTGATATNSYWDETTSGQTAAVGTGTAAASLLGINIAGSPSPYSAATYVNFDNGSSSLTHAVANTNGVMQIGSSPNANGAAWYIIQGSTRPLLAMELSTNIQNAHQLQLIAANLSGTYTLSQSFTAAATAQVNGAEVWNPTTGFVPIGRDPDSGTPFTGSLDGQSNTVDGLYINLPAGSEVGLFGYNEGTVSNLNLSTFQITGDNDVGAVAGENAGLVQRVQTGNASDTTSIVTGSGNSVGGIVGLNGDSNNSEAPGTITQSENFALVQGGGSSSNLGGIAGQNLHGDTVTQSINSGNIGTGVESNVGGLVGDNSGQVDDSYGLAAATIDGASNVGGLIGSNNLNATFETSYSLSQVTVVDSTTTGDLVGYNDGLAQHAYWLNPNAPAASTPPGIGQNGLDAQVIDVVGYTGPELTDINSYAQGASPTLWDFSPQVYNSNTGITSGGVWGVNVYDSNGAVNPYVSGNTVVGGLPVLQWQTPVNIEVSVASSTVPYGTPATYTATGQYAQYLTQYVNPSGTPPGPTLTVSDPNDIDAGSVHTVTLSGNPIYGGVNIEYVNGALTYTGGQQTGVTPTVTIVPADLTVTASSATIASGQMVPDPTASYSGFAYGETPTTSDLSGTLGYTYSPALSNVLAGSYAVQPGGQSSSNYNIIYVPGRLTITGSSSGQENQQVATVEGEITTIIDRFGNDPFNGLDPLYFLSIPNVVGLGGEFLGAINNEGQSTDYIYISSTSSLPAFSRLVTPGTGIVTIENGFVVVGNPKTGAAIYLNGRPQGLSASAFQGLQSVLSPAVYSELLALIYGHH